MGKKAVSVAEPIFKHLALSCLTFGLWLLVWENIQIRLVNSLMAQQGFPLRFSYGKWLLFTVLTLGVYHLYHKFRMGKILESLLVSLEAKKHQNVARNSVLLGLISCGILANAYQQGLINETISILLERNAS